MRSVLVVLALAGLAAADPINIRAIRERTRSMDPAVRASAAEQLARFRGSFALGFIESAAISDDPAVRGPLLDAMVREGVLPNVGAIHVPTAKVLERMLARLYPKRTGKELPEVAKCAVTAGTERSATVICGISRCEGMMHVTLTFELTTGVRWTAAEPQRKAVADGSCGDMM